MFNSKFSEDVHFCVNTLSPFTAKAPDYPCIDPALPCFLDTGNELALNTCPEAEAGGPCSSFMYSTNTFNGNISRIKTDVGKSRPADEESRGAGITHAKDSIHTSILSEWNLICDRSWLKPLTMSVFMLSLLLGIKVLVT